jgi:hypothetical protein
MIRDKNKPQPEQTPTINEPEVIVPEIQQNAFVEMYQAVKRAILTVRENPSDPLSEPFFKTIAMDNGQFQRIVREENTEMEIAFPAIFIHFINIRYLVQQQRIGEGRATMRIRFILNTLNNNDPDRECEAFLVFQQVNTAIQDAKNYEPALNERCNLTYFDTPLTTNMLQAYWIDYEVWFRETSAWKYRGWVERHLVMPPFTNHGDAPQHDKDEHGNHLNPVYKEVSRFEPSAGGNDEENVNEIVEEL